MPIPVNSKGQSDPGYWNLRGHDKRGKDSFHEWYSGIHGGGKKVKYKEHKPKGKALLLSKALLKKK